MATPTPEQASIVDAFKTGSNLVIEAGAGTGKTTTLKLMAESTQNRGVYIAYNRAIADDAKGSFPQTVHCATAHSFAFKGFGLPYKHRLNGPRITARQSAAILGINKGFELTSDVFLSPDKIARFVMDAITKFCNSADEKPASKHVEFIPNSEGSFAAFAALVAAYAQKAWSDITNKNGRLRFQHDHYLKMWAMSAPKLSCDFVLLDEAQDANPVIAQVVEAQDHAQKIMVGDQAQAIYGWRGATDAMSKFDCDQRLVLSQSFRFGNAIADEANKWLNLLDAPLRLKGFDKIDSKIESLDAPNALLCRTNAQAIASALEAQSRNQRVAIVGGTREIRMFAEGAADLMAGRTPYHADLQAFKTWDELRSYVTDDNGGADLKVFVKLIDTYGTDTVIRVADSSVNEDKADTIISTAHKSKGREWNTVRIANDFAPSDENVEPSRPEMMLAYVAVTRAQKVLDNQGLAWVDSMIGV